MAVQDGLQASGIINPTSSGLAVAFGIRATSFKVIASTSNQPAAYIDISGGNVLATTSAGFQMYANEPLTVPIVGMVRPPAYYTGFHIIAAPGTTATVRWIAVR